MILSNFPTKTITPESIGAIPNPSGGTTGQVLTKTSTGEEWSDAPSGLPEGGAEGQVIKKTADGAEWDNADWLPLSGGTVSGNLVVTGAAFLDNLDGGVVSIANSLSTDGGIDVNFNGTRLQGVDNPVSNSDAANKAYVDSKSPTSVTVTLTADGWTNTMAPVEPGGETLGHQQTVTVSGVVASETAQLITPTPAIASQSAYYEAGIMCTNQGTNSLTFTCQTVPTIDLIVYVVIQPLS